MTPRAVIFDLDDTLYPRARFVRSGLAAVAQYVQAAFGVPARHALAVMLEASRFAPGKEFQILCDRCGLPEHSIHGMVQEFRAHTPTLWLYHDAAAVLSRLRSDGWRLAVLTNGLPKVQILKLEALKLWPLVDQVVFAEEHAPGGKPNVATFFVTLERLGVEPQHAVMVGDDIERDIKGGAAAGLFTLCIDRSRTPPATGADVTLPDLSEVPAVADSLVRKVSAHAA